MLGKQSLRRQIPAATGVYILLMKREVNKETTKYVAKEAARERNRVQG